MFFPSPFFPVLPGLLLITAFTAGASAQVHESVPVPPGGTPLVSGPYKDAFTGTGAPDLFTIRHDPCGGPDRGGSWRTDTRRDASPAWAIQWRAPTGRPVTKGDIALVTFSARALETSRETGEAQMRVVVQNRGGAWARAAAGQFSLTRDWRTYYLPVRFPRDFPAGAAEVSFGFGYQKQAVEIADLAIFHYGNRVAFDALPRTRPTYPGRDPAAPWRAEALARIERFRKSGVTLAVTDAAGRPVPDAVVEIRQTRSAFGFGTAAPLSLVVSEREGADIWRRHLRELFNGVSLENDLKWPWWAGERGKPGETPAAIRERTLAGLRQLKADGFSVRGHVLVWPGWKRLPAAIVNLRGTPREKEIPAAVLAHITDITTATRGLIDEWDVLNEPFNNHDLMDLFGRDIMADWFHAARAVLPDTPLVTNDWGNHDITADPTHMKHFTDTTRFLLDRGAPVDGLGLQAHIGGIPAAPAALLATLDHYAKTLALPVRITEFDITTDDEDMQADYTRDFLTVMFSHPSVVGVQLWGFWEGAHWSPPAALYRKDWTEKPNGRVYRQLTQETWRIRETVHTDTAGRWQGRVFQGDYTVVVKTPQGSATRTFQVPPGTADVRWEISLE
ncbi:beta-1,4-xylanase [Opitutaceae bacterium TAV1]|nr:beta-1,4-xylanase [Opitutaceae bacterium TAV1]